MTPAPRGGLTWSGAAVTEVSRGNRPQYDSIHSHHRQCIRTCLAKDRAEGGGRGLGEKKGLENHKAHTHSYLSTLRWIPNRGTGWAEGNEFPTQLVTVVARGLDLFVSFEI